jgi:hypothetical protein
MEKDKLQTIVELNREKLLDILLNVGCSNWEAAQFAIEEYFIDEPCGDYDYHNYKKHFTNRYLKDETYDGKLRYRFGTALNEVFYHLFDVQISKGYIAIKKAVYKKMDELKEKNELWSINYTIDFEDWCSIWSEDFTEGDDEIVDINWVIKKNKKELVGS